MDTNDLDGIGRDALHYFFNSQGCILTYPKDFDKPQE